MAIANGRYKIISKGSMLPLDVEGGKIASASKIIQHDDVWSDTQLWTITTVPGRTDIYVIRATSDWSLLFNVQGGGPADGTNIILYKEQGNAENEQWRIVDQGAGYFKIVSVSSQKNLNVRGGSTASGAEIIQYQDAGGSANELWQLVKC